MPGASASIVRRAAVGVALAAGLAAAGLPVLTGAEAGRAGGAQVTLAASDSRPLAGVPVRLRARAARPPTGARIVLLVARLDGAGRVTGRASRPCAVGAVTCARSVRLAAPGRVRYRAVLRRAGRAVAASRPLVVAWREPAPVSGAAPEQPVGGGPPAPDPGTGAPSGPVALPGLPADTAGFEGWTRLNGAPIPADSPASQEAGVDAHRSTKDVYVNIAREVARTRPFPDGTIVVKAGRRGGDIALVAIMRRIAGIDPTHGNWQFVEYLADGRGGFATGPGLRDAGCWGCHGIAADRDWVFTPTDG